MSDEVLNTEVVTDHTPEPEVAPIPEKSASQTLPKTETAPATVTNAAVPGSEVVNPVYTPNFKFKAMKEEREFDEWMKPAIKDAETEKKAREILEKAYGLDHFKEKDKTQSQELGQYRNAFQQQTENINTAMSHVQRNDFDSFFEHVKIPNEKIYEWVLEKVRRQALPPEQRQVYDQLDAQKRQDFLQSRQMEEIQTQYRATATKAREAEVDYALAKPEVMDVVKSYDAKNGEGSFKQFVAEVGVMHFNLHGEDPSAEQAITSALNRIGDGWRARQATPAQVVAAEEKPLPVIPNVSGKNMSPIGKTPKSIDDIRKMRQEMIGA